MDNGGSAVYLALITRALAERIIPALNETAAQQLATSIQRLLTRVMINDEKVPLLRANAIGAYSGVIDEVKDDAALRPILDAPLLAGLADIEEQLQNIQARLISHGSKESLVLAGRVLAIDCGLCEEIERSYEDALVRVASPGAGLPSVMAEEEKNKLSKFLADQFPDDLGLEVVSVKPVPGGFSKVTLLVRLSNTRILPAEIVIRRDGEFVTPGRSVVYEFPLLQRLFDAGVAVAQPFAVEPTGAVLGRPFIVVAKVAGKAVGDFLEVHEPSRELAIDLARKLARLHALPPEWFGQTVQRGSVPVRESIAQRIDECYATWRSLKQTSIVLESAFAWLRSHLNAAEGAVSLVHRDIGVHNILVHNQRVEAFLDWEIPGFGNPAEDLGYMYFTVVQMIDWNHFLDAYVCAGGTRPTQDQIDFYTVWGTSVVAVDISRARASVLAGHLKDVELAYVGEHFFAKLLLRLSRKLTSLLS